MSAGVMPIGAEADDAPQQMHRYSPALGSVDLDHGVLAVLVQPRLVRGHVERIQMPAHGRGSVVDGLCKPLADDVTRPLRLTHFL